MKRIAVNVVLFLVILGGLWLSDEWTNPLMVVPHEHGHYLEAIRQGFVNVEVIGTTTYYRSPGGIQPWQYLLVHEAGHAYVAELALQLIIGIGILQIILLRKRIYILFLTAYPLWLNIMNSNMIYNSTDLINHTEGTGNFVASYISIISRITPTYYWANGLVPALLLLLVFREILFSPQKKTPQPHHVEPESDTVVDHENNDPPCDPLNAPITAEELFRDLELANEGVSEIYMYALKSELRANLDTARMKKMVERKKTARK